MRTSWQAGYLLIGLAMAGVMALWSCAPRPGGSAEKSAGVTKAADTEVRPPVERFPDVTETVAIGPIRWGQVMDRRPAVVRLLTSVRPWGETGAAPGRVRIDTGGGEFAGGWREIPQEWMPESFAVGVTGKVEF